jgi:hypothetical protein
MESMNGEHESWEKKGTNGSMSTWFQSKAAENNRRETHLRGNNVRGNNVREDLKEFTVLYITSWKIFLGKDRSWSRS